MDTHSGGGMFRVRSHSSVAQGRKRSYAATGPIAARSIAVASGVLLCLSSVARGAENEVTAGRTTRPPVIDGVIAADEWTDAARLEDFIQLEPRSGDPARERTVGFFLYDETSIYVAVRSYDAQPETITARLNNRDDDLTQDDSVTVFLDTFHDR